MKGIHITALLATVMLSGAFAHAETHCSKEWSVKAGKNQSYLSISIRENGRQGAACDLVVRDFHYIANPSVLSVSVEPVKFCPLDAIASRSANLQWQLPFELRSKADLQIVVNGSEQGRLVLSNNEVTIEGGCR